MVGQVQLQEERLRKAKSIHPQVLETGGTACFAGLHGKDTRVARRQKTGRGRFRPEPSFSFAGQAREAG